MKALLAHPGTQYSAQLARQLYWHDCLYRYWTSFALTENGLGDRILRLLPSSRRKWLGNRVIAGIPGEKLRTIPQLEIAALLRIRLGAQQEAVLHRRNAAFQRAIPESEIAASDVTIGFDTSSQILAARARALGRPLVLDQSIAHPRSKERVYRQIRHQFPEWSDDLETRAAYVMAGEDAEHCEATRISVASSFTKTTLTENGVLAEKIFVNPYGVDLRRFSFVSSPRTDRPYRFLFAGLVCARKGIPPLLKAWSALQAKDAELLIAGPISPEARPKLRATDGITMLGKVSNSTLATLMSECDAFVFPSYFEGFALVLLEAMASGLPVITTTATAGPDIVTQGLDGWVIEPGDVEALVHTMKFCLENRDKLFVMRANARATAERFSWDAYGTRWSGVLHELDGTKELVV